MYKEIYRIEIIMISNHIDIQKVKFCNAKNFINFKMFKICCAKRNDAHGNASVCVCVCLCVCCICLLVCVGQSVIIYVCMCVYICVFVCKNQIFLRSDRVLLKDSKKIPVTTLIYLFGEGGWFLARQGTLKENAHNCSCLLFSSQPQ